AVATATGMPPVASPAPPAPPPAGPPSARRVADWPVVPVIDAAMQARLRRILGLGLKMGNRPAVFAKAGDSITAAPAFLQAFACPGAGASVPADLAPVLAYFGATRFPADATKGGCGVADSFSRASVSAMPGWTSANALAPLRHPPPGCDPPYDTGLICELHLLRPGIVLIMFGTNDLGKSDDVDGFAGRLTVLVQQALALGTIPVLSTIPPRLDETEYAKRVPLFNAAIVQVAAAQQVPLWNYWLALQTPGLPNHGLSVDGIHPSVYGCPACDPTNLTPAGLRYGYNLRNWTALQVLATLKRVVIDAGSPDAGAGIDS
ncbi:MAG TPA: SGNH/GDSL hydrolase family protein, partial [Chloroflexia bacterium]